MPTDTQSDFMLVTPFEIALLLGHEDIIQVFEELAPDINKAVYPERKIEPTSPILKTKSALFRELLLDHKESSLPDISLPVKKS